MKSSSWPSRSSFKKSSILSFSPLFSTVLLILCRLLISEHGLCYLSVSSVMLFHCLSFSIVKENFPDSFHSPFYPLSERDFSSASLNYTVGSQQCEFELHRSSYMWIFQLTHICVARLYMWLDSSCHFISCIVQSLKYRKFSLKLIDCDFSWSLGSGASWRFSVLKEYRFSVTQLKADENLVLFLVPLAWF